MPSDRARVEQRMSVEERMSLGEQLDTLNSLVADLVEKDKNGGAQFTADERKALRKLLDNSRFRTRLHKLIITITVSASATALFFVQVGDYIRAGIQALKAAFR